MSLLRRAPALWLQLSSGLLTGSLLLGGCSRAPSSQGEASPAPSSPSESAAPSLAHKSPPVEPGASPHAEPPQEELPEAPQPPPVKKRYVVALLGDSLTDGRVGGGGYWKELRRRCPQSQFLDFGKGGDMTNQMRRRLERDVLPQVHSAGINTLLVYGGVNDLYSDETAHRTHQRITEDLSRIYQAGREHNLHVVALTVSPWGGFARYFNERRSKNTQILNSWILGQVAEKNIHAAVDTYPLLSCGNPEKLCPEYELTRPDGLHPGSAGHQVLAQALYEQVFSDCE